MGDDKVLIERIYDECGRLLIEQPYPFRQLFSKGQEQIIRGVSMTVLSCVKDGSTVTTSVRLHGEWK
jgi:hypothetical protein